MSGNSIRIGITECGDAGLNLSWVDRADEFDGLVLITKYLSETFIQQAARANSISTRPSQDTAARLLSPT